MSYETLFCNQNIKCYKIRDQKFVYKEQNLAFLQQLPAASLKIKNNYFSSPAKIYS